jgi:hypothetical protein
MSQKGFSEQVRKHFRYLIDDYGFSIVDEQHRPAFGGWSLVVFQSCNTLIRVELDRGRVLVDLGPRPEVPIYSFSLSTVIEFLAPGAEEPAYVFPEKWGDYSKVDWQVRRLARVLLQFRRKVLQVGGNERT